MQIITKLEAKAVRCRVYVDGEPLGWLRQETVKGLRWQEGDSWDEEAWEAAHAGPETAAAVEDGARYLAVPHTRAEVIRRLVSRGYREDTAERAADKLASYGYIDDEDYARRAVSSYALRGEGRGRILQRLRQKGLAHETAQSALEPYSQEQEKQTALREAQKAWHKNKDTDPQKRVQRTVSALSRRGYGWEIISFTLDMLKKQTEEE